LLAAALAWGFRWPALWAFLPLAKISTGLPLLWGVLRRDGRIVVMIGALLVVAAVSIVLMPGAWLGWLERLFEPNDERLVDGGGAQIPIPLLPRLLVAAAVTAWAAISGRRWPLAVALTLSLPQLWIHGFSILVALPILRRHRDRSLVIASPRASHIA
jgi:hypothetical protein